MGSLACVQLHASDIDILSSTSSTSGRWASTYRSLRLLCSASDLGTVVLISAMRNRLLHQSQSKGAKLQEAQTCPEDDQAIWELSSRQTHVI